MFQVRFVLVNLLFIFLPVLSLEAARYLFRRQSDNETHWLKPFLVITLFASSFLCTLFNFPISQGISLNLSIVPLSIGFFTLPWILGSLILGLYVISQLAMSLLTLSHGHLTIHVVTAVLRDLPRGMVLVLLFALIMCFTSELTKNMALSQRAWGFLGSLLLYTVLDYISVRLESHFPSFKVGPFIVFVLIFNVTFLLAVRTLIGISAMHHRHLSEIADQKMEIVSQLSASVAHEVRNPITVVRGFTQLMLENEYDRTKSTEFLETMITELSRAESVISDYLQLAKRPIENDFTEFNLSSVVKRCVQVMTPFAVSNNSEIEITTEDSITVWGNEESLTRAIINLVKNAVESYDHGGAVTVSLGRIGESVQLRVSDRGRGMANSELNKLGKPYYSTKTKGTGLGLTMVYKVMNDIGGKINVHSKEGVGTTFILSLPEVTTNVKAQSLNVQGNLFSSSFH